jgi:lysophospholipase L1-like esterase
MTIVALFAVDLTPACVSRSGFERELMPHFPTRRFLAMLAITIVACAAIVELSLRGLGIGHPLLYRPSISGYEVVPGQSVTRLFKSVRYNVDGLRNDPISAVPAEGVERILCLGDSITYGGAEIDNSETYTEKLRKLLPDIEVLNASAAGWSIVNESKWLAAHGLFGSKLLVLQIGENDLFEPFVEASLLDNHPSFPTHTPQFATVELFMRYVLPRLGLIRKMEDPGVAEADLDQAAADGAFEAIEQIRRYVAAHRATMMLLYIDPSEPSNDPRIIAARERMFAWAAQNSLRLVRPELAKRQSGDGAGRPPFRDYFHPSPVGNAIIAKDLAEALSHIPGLTTSIRPSS